MELEQQETVTYTNIPVARRHVFYISGTIGAAKEYKDMMHIIRNASEADEIFIHINSYGGDLFTTIQLLRVMAETNATITTSVEGACMSAATMIFLAGHQYSISEHSLFMFHDYSSGTIGKGGEMYDQISHERGWSKDIMTNVYKYFLSKSELKAMLGGKDFYMGTDEVIKRLEKRAKKYEKENTLEKPTESE